MGSERSQAYARSTETSSQLDSEQTPGKSFAQKLGQCKNVDDIFKLFFNLGATIMGASELRLDDLKAWWAEIRTSIDQGSKVAHEVAGGPGAGAGATSSSRGKEAAAAPASDPVAAPAATAPSEPSPANSPGAQTTSPSG